MDKNTLSVTIAQAMADFTLCAAAPGTAMTDFIADRILTLIAAARPAETRDWSEFEDEISDAISDSIDMDWSARDGARAVVALLNKEAPR